MGAGQRKIFFGIHSTAELQQVFHPCTHQAAGAGAGLGELLLWMMTLDFGASEAELTMWDCWHKECRWEQAAVVVQSWVVMQVPPVCVKIVLPSSE